jgi:hypothetical protein
MTTTVTRQDLSQSSLHVAAFLNLPPPDKPAAEAVTAPPANAKDAKAADKKKKDEAPPAEAAPTGQL